MKGYLISPLVFVVLFLIVSSFAFYVHQSDEAASKAIAREGEVKKAIASTQKELSAMGTIAFETMYKNPGINKKTVMEQKIKDAIKTKKDIDSTVTLSRTGKNTKLKLVLETYEKQYYNVKINLTGETYETVIGHPFYAFYEIYDSFNASEVCDYFKEDAVNCYIEWGNYKNKKKTETGFDFWPYGVTMDNCFSKKVTYKMNISDPSTIATQKLSDNDYSFKLKNKMGGDSFTADC